MLVFSTERCVSSSRLLETVDEDIISSHKFTTKINANLNRMLTWLLSSRIISLVVFMSRIRVEKSREDSRRQYFTVTELNYRYFPTRD